jgi:hypothetical protein
MFPTPFRISKKHELMLHCKKLKMYGREVGLLQLGIIK